MIISDIPIITYHKISPIKEFGVTTVSPQNFYNQIKYLYDSGFQTITFKDIYKKKPSNFPSKPIIITFDDTYQSVYEYAHPVLKRFNFSAVLFVITDFIGKFTTWEAYDIQKKSLHASKDQIIELIGCGYEIASHSKSHTYLPALSEQEIYIEVYESKCFLEKTFKQEIITFCYPYGRYSTRVIDQVTKAEYKYATNNLYLKSLPAEVKDYSLQRRSIYSLDNINDFSKKVNRPKTVNIGYILESLIQKGAYAGIIKKIIAKYI